MCIKATFFLGACLFSFNISSSSFYYIYKTDKPSFSNYGTTGLIQNPTSRLMNEGELSFSWSHNEPYLRGSIIVNPFHWFEASFQYTDINNQLYSASSEFSGSQSLKDKSFDAKFLLFRESKSVPQIAVGLRDIGGTGLFGGEYLVVNKRILDNLDISFGLGWGTLSGNKISNPLTKISNRFENRSSALGQGGKLNIDDLFSGDAGYFGGFEYIIPRARGIRLKLEYDGTNYQTETEIPQTQDSKINFGIIYPYSKNLFFKISNVRGNNLNFGFSYSLNLKNKNPFSIKKNKPSLIQNSEIIKNVANQNKGNLYRANLLYLKRQGYNLQHAKFEDKKLSVVFAQSMFRNPAQSAGYLLSYLDQINPDTVEEISISEVNGGLGIYSLDVSRDNYQRYSKLQSPDVLEKYININSFKLNENEYDFSPKADYPAVFNSIGPDLRSQIGGPDGFFFGDLKLTLSSEILFSRNLSLTSVASYGLYDNMDDLKLASDSVLPHVRTEIVQYLKQSRNFSFRRMQLNYYKQLANSFYLKLSGGILESMFNGAGFELLYRPFNKNYGIGLEVWQVYQRDFDQMFNILDYKTITGHTTFYYQEPNSNILFQIKGGRYLAKDSGFTFDASRVFDSGFRVGAFFSLTDISFEEFGEGSFDKGFYFWIPLDIFTNRHFRKTFGWGLRPITRDGAQAVNHGNPLWGVTNSASINLFRRNLDDLTY